jgi:hypothetical protein
VKGDWARGLLFGGAVGLFEAHVTALLRLAPDICILLRAFVSWRGVLPLFWIVFGDLMLVQALHLDFSFVC